MKKLLGIVVLGLMWCNVVFAGMSYWQRTNFNISHYLKNGWSITSVNSFKGWKNDETIYTLQKENLIISCKVTNFNTEKCYKPEN